MVDVLIPLIAAILILTKPDWFLKKDLDEETIKKKKALFNKIGLALIGVSILIFISKILIGLGNR